MIAEKKSAKTKVPLEIAERFASSLKDLLEPACERIEIAGSIRRRQTEVGDIELVAIPKPTSNLLGDQEYQTSRIINWIWEKSPPGIKYEPEVKLFSKLGKFYAQFTWAGMQVDLFMTTPDKWGCIYMIRTGSAGFSRQMMTKRSQGGFCPDHLCFKDGRLWNGDEVLDTPEEEDVFAHLGVSWLDPTERKG